jgi:energy-coupling factor transport system substrate-specific component
LSAGAGLLGRVVLALVPLTLLVCAALDVHMSALLTALVALAAVVVMLAGFERTLPGLRQVMPAVVLGSVAAAGRILFAPIPNFKPVSAIVIMCGAVYGKSCGFVAGALAAVVSNAFFGQGPWTPWQMYAWGLVGYVAGALSERGWLERPLVRDAFALLSGLLYGSILDSWNLVGWVHPITWQSAFANYSLGFWHNLMHGVATLVFLGLIWGPWERKLARVRDKYLAGADL